MNNSNNGVDFYCHGYSPAYEVQGLTCSLVVLHTMALMMFLIIARMIYQGVDIGHPVFAVIFQEVVFMPFFEFFGIVTLLASALFKSEVATVLYFFVIRTSSIFHPVTWVMVSYLRQVGLY